MLPEIVLISVIMFLFLSICVSIAQIGKPKQPTTPGVALVAVIINGLFIAGLWYVLLQLN